MTAHTSTPDGSTSSGLLLRLRARDDVAWREFVYIYQPLILEWCQAQRLQAADAADVAQDVFRSVDRAIGDFVGERPGAFRGWLYTITLNAIRQLWRRRQLDANSPVGGSTQQQRLAELADGQASASSLGHESERKLVFRRALEIVRGEFEAATFTAFSRTAVDGRAAPEAAAELGMSPAAVRQAKARVLRRLRDLLIEGDGLPAPQ